MIPSYTGISVRLTPAQFQKFKECVAASTCRTNAEYARKLILGKPVRGRVYNASLDILIEELVALRRELATLAGNPALSPQEKVHLNNTLALIQNKIDQIADRVCKSKL
ncbi:MAG: hypothetical protein Q8937_17675 [Bacteroidota bacterium]|nr:hypothetical protein [Bacteroidota bacterium]